MRGDRRKATLAGVGAVMVFGALQLPGSLDVTTVGRTEADQTGANDAGSDQSGSNQAGATHALAQNELVCPGPEALGVRGLKDAKAQRVDVFAAAPPTDALPSAVRPAAGGRITVSGLPSGGSWPSPMTARSPVPVARTSSPRSPLITATGEMAPGLVATQRSLVTSGDDRALVGAACGPAAPASWLIGGGAEAGRRERVVLTNPGPNPVTVDLDVFGLAGPVPSPGGQGIVVAAYDRTVVLLDSISGAEKAPAVRVTARGGEIAAVLGDTWLDGVVPRGGDDCVPAAPPSREQVIPGVAVSGTATVRVAVPGDSEAVVQTRVLTPRGPQAIPGVAVARVAGGATYDIDLRSLPPDAYAVQLRADEPIVAGAMVGRRGEDAASHDFAWSASSVPIRSLAGSALRSPGEAGTPSRIDLVATGDDALVTLTTVGPDGRSSSQRVAVPGDTVRWVPLPDAMSVWVTPVRGTVRAATVSSFRDRKGELLSVSPLPDLTLRSTGSALLEIRD